MNALVIDFALVWESLPAMLNGLWTTMLVTIIVLVLGLIFCIPLTLARMSSNRVFALPAAFFVMFFRGAPLLILLYLVYYGFGQIEALRDGPLWFIFGSAFACAVIGLTLNHLAFMVDVVREVLRRFLPGLAKPRIRSESRHATPSAISSYRWRCGTGSRPTRTKSSC